MDNRKNSSFKRLLVWQKSIELVKKIYGSTQGFPAAELYGMTSQMRRAAISIPSNIAEGTRRRFDKEQKQFFNIALGSCAELETQLEISQALGYLDYKEVEQSVFLLNHISAMLVNLAKRL